MKAATIGNVERILDNIDAVTVDYIEFQKTRLSYSSKYQWRFVLRMIFLCLLFFVVMGAGRGVCAEKNIKASVALSKSIYKHLIESGFCSSGRECIKKLDVYVGRGSHIAYSIYGKNNKKMIAAFIGFVIENGTEITQGVPITIAVYPKSREEYGSIFISPKAIINVEVQ